MNEHSQRFEEMNAALGVVAQQQRGSWKILLAGGAAFLLLSPLMEHLVHPEWRQIAGVRIWWICAGAGLLVIVDSLRKLMALRKGGVSFAHHGIHFGLDVVSWQDLTHVFIYRQAYSNHGVTSEHCRIQVTAGGRKYTILHGKYVGEMKASTQAAFKTITDGVNEFAFPALTRAVAAAWESGRGYRLNWRTELRPEGVRVRRLLSGAQLIPWYEVADPTLVFRNWFVWAEWWIAVLVRNGSGDERKVLLGALDRTPNVALLINYLRGKRKA